MELPRASGILLPVSSLPGRFGIGDLGPGAYRFVDWLAKGRQSFWQIIPLGAPGNPGHRDPYSALSSWAASPHYVSLEQLVEEGDLIEKDLKPWTCSDQSTADYAHADESRAVLLPRAAQRFFERAKEAEIARYRKFTAEAAWWLDDWSLFAALRQEFQGAPWWEWPRALVTRSAKALDQYRTRLAQQLAVHCYVQYRFFEQWGRLRRYAQDRGIRIIGDLPIYCEADSQDVWANQQMFKLKTNGQPAFVGGVPPDYFSADGQLWGNPVFDWPRHEKDGFRWWISRLNGSLATVDLLRIDHFRGLESYWEVRAGAPNARKGKWRKGPGDTFFRAVKASLGEAPFIAEDLGIITPEVVALRDRWNLPGMRVLHFAFSGDPSNDHLPHRYTPQVVAYTGTHDNDTSVGWYRTLPAKAKKQLRAYSGAPDTAPHETLIRLLHSSVANLAVIPMTDILGLGPEARLNIPGRRGPRDKWYRWKLTSRTLSPARAQWLGESTALFGR